VKIDRELPLDEAALFGCAVLTGVGAVVNTAKVRAGASVAVVGLGGVGLNALLGASAAGARRIVAIDLSDEKLGLDRQFGATDTYDAAAPEVIEDIREATGGGVPLAPVRLHSRVVHLSPRTSAAGRSTYCGTFGERSRKRPG
jgi:alcohol dehydrogenase